MLMTLWKIARIGWGEAPKRVETESEKEPYINLSQRHEEHTHPPLFNNANVIHAIYTGQLRAHKKAFCQTYVTTAHYFFKNYA